MKKKSAAVISAVLFALVGGFLLLGNHHATRLAKFGAINRFSLSGGSCPAGSNYLNAATNALGTLSSLGVTSGCYYIAANGSDSNDGLSEASGHPWLHAPFMPNCSATCLSVQNSMAGTAGAGLGFIFRGGDTWHFGNSGATPFTGGTWAFNPGSGDASGTPTHPIYFGFDSAWFSGVSWAKPILTGDNPLCGPGNTPAGCNVLTVTSSSYQQYYVNSCAFQNGGANNLIDESWIGYMIFDSFEQTGLCGKTVGQPFGNDSYNNYNDVHGTITFQNLYIHGKTHISYAGANDSSACNTKTVYCITGAAFEGVGYSSSIIADTLRLNAVDFSDSDPWAEMLAYASFYDVQYNVFRYTAGALVRSPHLFCNNYYDHFVENGHGNVLEAYGDWPNGDNVVCNNVFSNLDYQGQVLSTPGIWMWPNQGDIDFIFGNVVSSPAPGMELFNIGRLDNAGTYDYFNDTFDMGTNNTFGCQPTAGYTWVLNLTNIHFISELASPLNSVCQSPPSGGGPVTQTTNLLMNHVTATSDGYTSGQTNAYSPTSGSSPTVTGPGTNLNGPSSPCGQLATAAASDPTLAGAANLCKSGTSYACSYNSTTHAITCPALAAVGRPTSASWNIGAYQFSGTPALPSPTISPANGAYSSPQTISISGTAGATFCYTVDGSTPTGNGAGTCTHGTTYSSSFSQSIPVTVKAIATKSGSSDSAAASNTYTLPVVPVITSATVSTCPVNLPCSYQITATGSPTSFSATGLPGCLTVNTSTGLISGTCPSLATYSGITLGATSGAGTGNASLTVTVGYFVQAIYCLGVGSDSSVSCDFPLDVTSGDVIIVPFDFVTGGVVSSVTDTLGNTFHQIGSQLSTPGGDTSQVWAAYNVIGGTDTVTVAFTASQEFLDSWLAEYTGLLTTNPLDSQAGASGSTGPANSGNFSASVGNELIFGFCIPDDTCASPGSGFTVRSSGGDSIVEDQTQASPGTYNATATITGTGWTMQGIGLKPIGASAIPQPRAIGVFAIPQ